MTGATFKLVMLLLLALGVAGGAAVLAHSLGEGPRPDGDPAQGGAPRPALPPQAGGAAAARPGQPRPAAEGVPLTLKSERQRYRRGETIDLLLGVTNPGKKDFECLRPPLNILANLEVTGPDGKKVAPVLNPREAIASLPASSGFERALFIVGPGQTSWIADALRWVNVPRADTGTYIRRGYFPMDTVGRYRLRVRLGKAVSNELTIQILGDEGLAESKAIEVRQVEFRTVVEQKCPVPPAGGRQHLYLGLRLTNRGQAPLLFNRYDTLRSALSSADGTALEVKMGQRLRSYIPAPVLVAPGKTETVLRSPQLEWLPDGKTLRLKGPDGAGGFWYADGLRPGKYLVRFEYENTPETQARLPRSSRFQPGPGQSFWLGKATTYVVAFEIAP
jgi:hypothetical protein